MKTLLLFIFIFLSGFVQSQPTLIYYGNDSLIIDQYLIKGTESKQYLDRLMQSESKNGIIISTHDEIVQRTEQEKQRRFDYRFIGVNYLPYLNNPSNFTLSIRFEYEPEELKIFKLDSTAVYKGMLVIGNQFFNAETSVEKILNNPAFSFIKKGEIKAGKRKIFYSLLSFENILIKVFNNPVNGHVKRVELLK